MNNPSPAGATGERSSSTSKKLERQLALLTTFYTKEMEITEADTKVRVVAEHAAGQR